MAYYSEAEMGHIRSALEETVLSWLQVSTKKRFGCPSYLAGNHMFAMLVTDGIVITKLDVDDRAVLLEEHGSEPCPKSKKDIQHWVRIPIYKAVDLEKIIPFVKKSYEIALQEE
jgi:predicted DNA-binding protein (MmcQ/YjbR family)